MSDLGSLAALRAEYALQAHILRSPMVGPLLADIDQLHAMMMVNHQPPTDEEVAEARIKTWSRHHLDALLDVEIGA